MTNTEHNMQQSKEFIRMEREGHIGVIVFARSERRNALNFNMYAEIAMAMRAYQEDEDVRVILLCGEGKDFCAGNDIGDFQNFGTAVKDDGVDPQSFLDRGRSPSIDLAFVFMETDKPVIACVQGNAVGFGATMLLHCDVVIAEPDARLTFPFVNLALVPEAGSSLLLKERVGFLKAADILYNARSVGAEEGQSIDLISEIVGKGEARARGLEMGAALAAKPPIALRVTKRLLKADVEPLADRVMEEFKHISERSTSPEAQAVFAKFLKK
ncbi:MAG: enoyl-CoA hydratase-related protein [Pseudomonadota bacterium]